MRELRRRPAHGYALLVSIILLAVLTVMGVATVSLASQERTSAAGKLKVDKLMACAAAAQQAMWAEMVRWGPGYLGSSRPITSVTLPDGTQLIAPGHYGQQPGGSTPPTVSSVVLTVKDGASGGLSGGRDQSNVPAGSAAAGQVQTVIAHCKDPQGREYEIELAVRLAL
jgi:hypothetical protein